MTIKRWRYCLDICKENAVLKFQNFVHNEISWRFLDILFSAQPLADHIFRTPSSLWMQPWPYPDATCLCSSSPSYPTYDKPVYIQVLLEDLLVGHSSNIMQFQALCIFHSGEGMSNYIAVCLLLLYEHQAYIGKRLTRH